MTKDMMEVYEGQFVHVPGYDKMVKKTPVRALALRAFVRFELRNGSPRKDDVLKEMNALGANLSKTSGQAVMRQIEALVEANHIIDTDPRGDDEASRMGRGGKARKWRSVYVKRTLVDRVANNGNHN